MRFYRSGIYANLISTSVYFTKMDFTYYQGLRAQIISTDFDVFARNYELYVHAIVGLFIFAVELAVLVFNDVCGEGG